MRAGAQPLLLHGSLQQALAVAREFTVAANLPLTHLRIGIDALPRGGKAVELHFTRPNDSFADLSRAFSLAVTAAQLLVIHCRNVNVDVNAVHQRPGYLRYVPLDHRLRAVAFTRRAVI